MEDLAVVVNIGVVAVLTGLAGEGQGEGGVEEALTVGGELVALVRGGLGEGKVASHAGEEDGALGEHLGGVVVFGGRGRVVEVTKTGMGMMYVGARPIPFILAQLLLLLPPNPAGRDATPASSSWNGEEGESSPRFYECRATTRATSSSLSKSILRWQRN